MGRTGSRAEGAALVASPESDLMEPLAGTAGAAAMRSERSPAAALRTRACIRGRLVIDESGEPLDEVLRVCLHTGNPEFLETLETAADGSFESTIPFARGVVLARVMRPNGDMAVDREGAFDPAEDSEWIVRVPWPTFLHGTVVDGAGRALEGIELFVSRREQDRGGYHGYTRDEGEFRLQGLRTGRCTLMLSNGFERSEIRLDVRRGPNELGALRVPFAASAGSIGGRLLAPGGEPRATLFLRDSARGLVLAQEVDSREAEDGLEPFLFEDLPPGAYELELVSGDGRRYEPTSRRVSPPADELEFVAVGAAERFELLATDGRAELETHALVRVRGQWLVNEGAFAHAEVERWIAAAPGHRPLAGERPEKGVLRVRLEPGYGRVYLVSEMGGDLSFPDSGGQRGRPLGGVEVVTDGRAAATSDADGMALVSLSAPPSSLEFRLPGWHVHQRQEYGELSFVALERD